MKAANPSLLGKFLHLMLNTLETWNIKRISELKDFS